MRLSFELSQTLGNQTTFTSATFNLSVSTAPEPSAWALMVVAFGGVAARMKALKKPQKRKKAQAIFSGLLAPAR